MNLFDNPIFLTQKRLTYRAGVLVAILLAAVIGLYFLYGLGAFLINAVDLDSWSKAAAGHGFYGRMLAMEILILPLFGLARISRALNDDRKSGMWESNRLTPLSPSQLVAGYWFGSALRELYMGAVLAAIGLVIVLLAGLPFSLWLETQILVLSMALLLGLLAVLLSISTQKAEGGGAVIFLALIIMLPISLSAPRMMVTSFLVPLYGIMNLLDDGQDPRHTWVGDPSFFGLEVPPILFSLALQLIIAIFIWRAVTRKVADPLQPPLWRWEAMALFGVLLAAQHGLMWGQWRGQFPATLPGNDDRNGNMEGMMPLVQVGAMVLGLALLSLISPPPERVRVEALRTGAGNLRLVFSRSALSLALALTAIAGVLLLTQGVFSLAGSGKIFLIAVVNLFNFYLIFTLLLECCRVRFRLGAAGFIGLALFILCVLPFILAGVFADQTLGRFSLLSPGFLALEDPGRADLTTLLQIDLGHFGIAVGLFLLWLRQWKRLLAKAAPAPAALAPPIG